MAGNALARIRIYRDSKPMTHFLTIPFTGLGLFEGYRGDTWLKNRIAIFKQFVLPSILGQTEKNFWIWLQFRPQEETNPIVQEFVNSLGSIRGLRVIVTYHGITMWDDKYSDEIAKQRLIHSLEKSLPELEQVIEGDYVLDTIQPSDDIYMTNAVELIQKAAKKKDGAFGWRKGYIMKYDSLDVAEYNPKTIPPFFTVKYPRETFLSPKKHFDFAPFRSHEYIADHLDYHDFRNKRGFIVGTHGENTSTSYALAGRKVSNEVLIKAGLFGVEPLTVKKDKKRILKKKFLNLFPASWQRWYIRKLSPGVREAIRTYTYFNI